MGRWWIHVRPRRDGLLHRLLPPTSLVMASRSRVLRPCERVEFLRVPGIAPSVCVVALVTDAGLRVSSSAARDCYSPSPLCVMVADARSASMMCAGGPGVDSCGRSMLWSHSWRRMVDQPWSGRSSPVTGSSEPWLGLGGVVM